MIDRAVFPIRRRKHARPRELLVAARDLFIEKGFAATRAEEIAARAGVSKGTLYIYFDSKEELLNDLIAQRFFCEFPFKSLSGHDGAAARSGRRRVRSSRASSSAAYNAASSERSTRTSSRTRWCCP